MEPRRNSGFFVFTGLHPAPGPSVTRNLPLFFILRIICLNLTFLNASYYICDAKFSNK